METFLILELRERKNMESLARCGMDTDYTIMAVQPLQLFFFRTANVY